MLILALFRLCGSEFTYWDDQATIHANGRLNPPTLDTLRFYWTTPDFGLYVPVTYTVWAVVAKIAYVGRPDEFGILLNPWPFHTISVIVHIASALLVLNLLRRLIGQERPALVGALLFGLHPVQVETVGWISGFKDVLCWCLSLASLLTYVRGVQVARQDGRPLWRGWEMPVSCLLLAMAILSKPTAMVIPAAMWIIGWLLLHEHWRRTLLTLIPHLAIAAIGAVLARQAQYVDHVKAAALWQRPFIVGDTLVFYFGKILWPARLTFDYGRPPAVAMQSPWAFVLWIVPLALLCLAWRNRDRWPIGLAALGLFVVGVAPVSGITTFQMQNYSTVTDHYLYFAMLGPALLAAWSLAHWPRPAFRVLAALVLVALAARTFVQTAVWHDSYTLFGHGLASNPKSYLARANLAVTYMRSLPPRPDIAERYANEAYALAPDLFFVLDAYATTKAAVGNLTEAKKAWNECDKVLMESPRMSYMRADFATTVSSNLLALGDKEEAMIWAKRAIELQPRNPHAFTALAAARAATQPAKGAATTRAATTTTTGTVPPPASMPSRAVGPG
jgi:hypothetical protein